MEDDQDFSFGAGDDRLPDLPEAGGVPQRSGSVLDGLRTELAKRIIRPQITLEVPERPKMVLAFTPNIANGQLREWRQKSGENAKSGVDIVKLSCFVVAYTCVGVYFDGEIVTEDGKPVTFHSDLMLELTGAPNWREAVRSLFGLDPHVVSASMKVLEAAGYDDEVGQADPTKTS